MYSKSLVFLLVIVFVFTSSTAAQKSLLSSLSLNQCIQLALKNNPGFNAVEYQLRESQTRTKEAQSAWYPTVNLSMNARQYPIDQYPIEGSGISDQSYSAGIYARYTLFDGFGRTNSVKAAKSNYRAEEMWMQYNRDDLVYSVSKAYYRLWQAKEEVQVAEKSLERVRSHLEYAKTRVEIGIATQSDILKARVEVWNAYITINEASERIHNTELLYDNAYENLLIAEGEYREGIGSMLDLIDAQTALADADGRRIEALRDYYTALAKLRKVTGINNIEEVLK